MNDIVQCPRRQCNSICLVDSGNLARCPKCQYTFCPRCLRLGHPGKPCSPSSEISEVTKQPQRKLESENGERGDDSANQKEEVVNFVRYEDEEIPTLGGKVKV